MALANALTPDRKTNEERFILKGRVLDSTTASSTGTWVRINGRYPVTICFGGTATAVVWRVLVSNSVSQPTDNNHPAVGSATGQTANGVIQLDAPYEWINVVPDTVSGGTAYADIWAG